TDMTIKRLMNLQHPKLKILEQKHQGPAMARNYGAKQSKGKILVFVDADMTFDSKFLQNLVKPIEKNITKGTFSKDEYVANWDNAWARCWNINENLPEKRRLPSNYPDHQKVFRAILKSEFDTVEGFSKGGYTDDYTLSEKLGYEAELAPGAVFYHKNPETVTEIYKQAKWVGKREYKLGIIGYAVALVRSSFPVSLVIGIYKSILHMNLNFIIFKLVYDFGIFTGILEMLFTGKTAK
ncbi:MAG TPA: glycosyltransferase, partial [Candidatus Saccharimonadales bacterium]|nr:glycosyltransferase [Candidatus Saccharimonadales bacterium]